MPTVCIHEQSHGSNLNSCVPVTFSLGYIYIYIYRCLTLAWIRFKASSISAFETNDSMDRLWRSNSSISSRTGCPPDIINEEDHNVDDSEIIDFSKWTIPKVDTKNVYKISWVENTFHSAYKVRTVEQIFSISKTHEKCCLFTKKNIGEFLASKKFSYLHIGMVQVAIKPLTRKGINAFVLMCLHDARLYIYI